MLKTGSQNSSCRCNDFNSSSRNKKNVFYITYKNFIDSDSTLFDGPTVSGIAPLVSSADTTVITYKCASSHENKASEEENKSLSTDHLIATPTTSENEIFNSLNRAIIPASNLNNNIMPSANGQPSASTMQAVIVRSTTTAEILDENRFSMMDKSPNHGFDAYDLPLPANNNNNNNGTRNDTPGMDMEMKLLNTSCGTSVSAASTPSSSASPKKDNISIASSSISSSKRRKNAQTSNQGDVNSIESISESTYPTLAVSHKPTNALEVDWIDDLMADPNSNQQQLQEKQQKHFNHELPVAEYRVNMKKHKTRERDQLDGVTLRLTRNDVNSKQAGEDEQDEDEKVVKCLYYTLMCCDCTIS